MPAQRQHIFRLVQLTLIILAAAGPIGLVAARSDWRQSRLLQSTVTPSSPDSTPTLDPNQPVIYIVQAGDTLTQIADKFGLALAQLLKLNQLQSDSIIVVGQKLIVGSAPATPLPSPTVIATVEVTATPLPSPTPPPSPTAIATAEATATPLPSSTPGTDPETITPTPSPQPTVAVAPPPPDTGLPIDVIVVMGLMGLAIVGLVIGFRMQRG